VGALSVLKSALSPSKTRKFQRMNSIQVKLLKQQIQLFDKKNGSARLVDPSLRLRGTFALRRNSAPQISIDHETALPFSLPLQRRASEIDTSSSGSNSHVEMATIVEDKKSAQTTDNFQANSRTQVTSSSATSASPVPASAQATTPQAPSSLSQLMPQSQSQAQLQSHLTVELAAIQTSGRVFDPVLDEDDDKDEPSILIPLKDEL